MSGQTACAAGAGCAFLLFENCWLAGPFSKQVPAHWPIFALGRCNGLISAFGPR
jgi:hypothetical protein